MQVLYCIKVTENAPGKEYEGSLRKRSRCPHFHSRRLSTEQKQFIYWKLSIPNTETSLRAWTEGRFLGQVSPHQSRPAGETTSGLWPQPLEITAIMSSERMLACVLPPGI